MGWLSNIVISGITSRAAVIVNEILDAIFAGIFGAIFGGTL